MSIVVCKLPKAGLGNQLFPLMKAYTFAHLNKMPIVVTGYNQFFIGPYLRGEKSKRRYNGFFVFQRNYVSALIEKRKLLKYKKQCPEPQVQKIDNEKDKDCAYVFSEMPHWDHYFDGLKEHRSMVIDLLNGLVLKKIHKQLSVQQIPCIGVHIRMGDFRKLRTGEVFGDAGAVRTPETYFVEVIEAIRNIHGSDLPVTVFTDGFKHEFDQLFNLANIIMNVGKNDMADLLLLSKSKVIVTSGGSTFSYWAAFLSDAAVVMHPRHVSTIIRPVELNGKLYHGAFDSQNSLLVNSIKDL